MAPSSPYAPFKAEEWMRESLITPRKRCPVTAGSRTRTQETKRFHDDEKSQKRDPRVFVDSGRPFPDEQPLLTTRVHLRESTADLLWRELLRVGWQPCCPQWNADADI